jgi:PAS domain S-box-containing protein
MTTDPGESSGEEVTQLRNYLNDLAGMMASPLLWAGGAPPQVVTNTLEALLGETSNLIATNERLTREVAEHRQTEEALRALRQREGQFRLLVETIPALVWRGTPEGELDYLNQRAVDYLGHTAESLANGRWLELVHPDHREATIRRWLQSATTGSSYSDIYRLRRADGQYRWIQSVGEPFRDMEGRITHWYGLIIDIEDRRRAEEALRESGRESRLIVDTIPGLVATLTAAGEVDFVNDQLIEYCGQGLDAMRQWGTNGTVHVEDVPRIAPMFAEAIASGEPYDFEARVRRFDGVYRWVQIRGLPLRDTNDRIVRWYVLLTDIDDRKRAEEAIRASESNLKLIIDTIPALAWSAGPDGGAEFLSQHYLNFVGLSAEQARNWGWTAAVHPDDMSGLAATWQRIMASQLPGDAEARLRRYDGTYRWFLFRASPMRDTAGAIVKWYGVNTDIEDRKRAEEALTRSEAFMMEGQHLARVGNFAWRVATDEIMWSEQLYRIYELEIGLPVTLELIRTRVHPEDLTLLEKMVEHARDGGRDFEWQYRLLMPDHSIKYLHAVAHAIRDQHGQLEYIAAVQDVTARRLSEQALDKARSELAHVARVMSLGALTASITHEVNQPLSGIITNASTCLRMLDTDPPNVDGARETARRAIRDGNRASDVIARLRALFSRKDFTLEPLDLNEATREVIALSLSDLQRNRVVLQSELADELPTVTGDRIQLQQVVLNLLRNASDAMMGVDDRPRDLLIRTEREHPDRVRVTVRDAGVGLDRQSIDKLFDAFYTTKSGGMGIGLSVSRTIVERHQGRLWAEPNDGPGATFAFSIPLAPEGITDAALRSHT